MRNIEIVWLATLYHSHIFNSKTVEVSSHEDELETLACKEQADNLNILNHRRIFTASLSKSAITDFGSPLRKSHKAMDTFRSPKSSVISGK